jgi:hypothetical protein
VYMGGRDGIQPVRHGPNTTTRTRLRLDTHQQGTIRKGMSGRKGLPVVTGAGRRSQPWHCVAPDTTTCNPAQVGCRAVDGELYDTRYTIGTIEMRSRDMTTRLSHGTGAQRNEEQCYFPPPHHTYADSTGETTCYYIAKHGTGSDWLVPSRINTTRPVIRETSALLSVAMHTPVRFLNKNALQPTSRASYPTLERDPH